MDVGLCTDNYFDFEDVDIALQREIDLMDEVEGNFTDSFFPPDSRSLYFDSLNPPNGCLPASCVKWQSISLGEVINCDSPILFGDNSYTSMINQGALGNGYFVNALRLLACEPKYLKRLLVSTKFSSQGCYTWKFSKAGKWRYVNIDDRIPCTPSGKVNFCRNLNPQETFAMLIEKAYAKLHGCYEALNYGFIEKALVDLTQSAHVAVHRENIFALDNAADVIWDTLESGLPANKLIGVGRWISDPYSENAAERYGISLGTMYQVVDVCAVTADATADLDALTVGMVCVRILQRSSGRFTGRWSYGDRLWSDYPAIGETLSERTINLQKKYNIEDENEIRRRVSDPVATAAFAARATSVMGFPQQDVDDEIDNVDVRKNILKAISKAQPDSALLFWMQIEDFVDVFNKMYIVTDPSLQAASLLRVRNRRYFSKWIPGDFLGGSGGPPVWYADMSTEEVEDAYAQRPVGKNLKPIFPSYRRFALNSNFTDNPMYPFSVTEPAVISICLFQDDKRWSVDRIGGDAPRDALAARYLRRHDRLASCLKYPIAIGFLVLKLCGLKVRVTDFKLKKIVAGSDNLEFSNVVSTSVELRPGRYAIVPYTHSIVNRAMDYVLSCTYSLGTVDFEIEDIHEQRLVDTEASDDDEETEADTVDDEDSGDETSTLSSPRGMAKPLNEYIQLIPKPPPLEPWEYEESIIDSGLTSLYGEVGLLSKYVGSLRKEVNKLDNTVRAVQDLLDNAIGPKSRMGNEPAVNADTKRMILNASLEAKSKK